MKIFTNKSLPQKILIVIMIIVMLGTVIPKPVNAGIGGVLRDGIISFVLMIPDAVQHLLEWAMLGRTEAFLHDVDDKDYPETSEQGHKVEIQEDDLKAEWLGFNAVKVPVIRYTPEEIFSNRVPRLDANFIKPSVKVDGASGDAAYENNTAKQLQPYIASWYVAIRTLAIVGLLSVLVYMGIRMLLSGIAADKAKYKKMLFDWLVAMILIFSLHYIMSFALTMAEVVTAMVSGGTGVTTNVYVMDGNNEKYSFSTNLMGYIRFRVQSKDTVDALSFLLLYIMLVVFSVMFTWTYLKRLVNMAFLTLIAPVVALTYPIDKAGDGQAQAFNLWIKEFSFNAILQPLHLFLYMVLCGTASDLATENPLYAIVALGFILGAEKLVKQMFGFNKAGAGTVGSLAGATAVATYATRALTNGAKKNGESGGGGGKRVRTKDSYERDGKDTGANKDYQSFDTSSNRGIDHLDLGDGESSTTGENNTGGNGTGDVPPPPSNSRQNPERLSGDEQEEMANLNDYFNNADYNDPFLNPEVYQENSDRLDELEKKREAYYGNLSDEERAEFDGLHNDISEGLDPDSEEYKEKMARYNELSSKRFANEEDANNSSDNNTNTEGENVDAPNTANSPNPRMTREALEQLGPEPAEATPQRETVGDLWEQDKARMAQRINGVGQKFKSVGKAVRQSITPEGKAELKRKISTGAYKTARGVIHAAPTVAGKVARGVVKTGFRAAAGVALGATVGAIAATSGNGDAAIAAALGGLSAGAGVGGRAFEGTVGRIMPDNKTIRDSYDTGKYGNATDARNKRADKEYLKSQELRDEYEKHFKDKMSMDEFKKATLSYRQSGITDKKTIRKALKLEEAYKKNGDTRSAETIRANVQNIAQTYDNISKKAVYGEDKNATMAALRNIEGNLSNIEDPAQKRAVAKQIMQGYRDWYNAG